MPTTQETIPTQKPLFTYICTEDGHDFGVIGDGYYKSDRNDEPIKGKVYRMILCPRCGESREILIVDRTSSNGVVKKIRITRRKVKK